MPGRRTAVWVTAHYNISEPDSYLWRFATRPRSPVAGSFGRLTPLGNNSCGERHLGREVARHGRASWRHGRAGARWVAYHILAPPGGFLGPTGARRAFLPPTGERGTSSI